MLTAFNISLLQHGSASGAICKHIRKWVRKFSKDELEFYALHLPSEPWKRLADICHFNPKKVYYFVVTLEERLNYSLIALK